MYDSINAWAIPVGAQMVAGYVDCSFAWTPAAWARFPNAVKVKIAAGCDPQDAQVCDVERGDYMPWEAPDFCLVQRAKGIDPTCYVNLSNWNPTRTEFRLRGIPEPHWWLALYDGVATIPSGCVAKQHANSAMTGGNYDLSIAADFWPGVDNVFGPGGDSAGDHMDLSNPIDKIVYDSVSIIKDGLFKQDAAAGILAADGSHVAIQDAIANTLADVLTLTAKVDALNASVAALKTGAAPDLSGITASLTTLNAKIDAIASRLAKDLA